MKKFAKIMALALALCMVMSVAAFADSPSTPTLVEDQILNVSVVTGGTSDEQVALLILKAGAPMPVTNDTDIVYVGQMAATAGTAAFDGITINGLVDEVDIYAGSATYAANNGNTYDLVAEDFALTDEVTDVAVVMGSVAKVNNQLNAEDSNLFGSAVSAEFSFTLPTNGVTITKADMIWSLRAGSTVKYTKPIDITSLVGLDGDVRLSVAFANGTVAGEAVQEITGASAIFKFVRSDKTQEIVLDDDDEANDARLNNN